MKIAFFNVFEGEEDVFRDLLKEHEVKFFDQKLDENNVKEIKDFDIVSVFVTSSVRREIIDRLPKVKLIATRSTGYDHIDVEYAKSKGIEVATVPAYGSNTVAEFTFGLLLTLSRKVYQAYNNLREDMNFDQSLLSGFDLYGKTLGVIGAGKIGRNVIKIARGFGMNVLASDRNADEAFAKELGFEYVDFDTLIKNSDVITLHVPYFKENHHMINKDVFAKMKKGVCIINTARGELIDTEALVNALGDGKVAGAGLDVLEGERELRDRNPNMGDVMKQRVEDYKVLLEGHMLIDMDNVIVTPHIAFYSKEAEAEIVKVTAENINNFSKGIPSNLVKL